MNGSSDRAHKGGPARLAPASVRRGAPCVLVLALLAGCGERPGSPEKLLRVSNWLHAAVEPEFLRLERDLETEFEVAHPGVGLKIEPIPGPGQYAPKLLLMHISGRTPDAGYLDLSSGAVFIDNGVAADLAPYIESDERFRLDDYFANTVDCFRRDGRIYGIPLDFTPMVMYYNKRLFDAAGVAYPRDGWTWDEFVATAGRLTIPAADASGPMKQYGMHFENVMPFWIVWLWNGGGDVLSPDGRRASGWLDGPRSVDAIDFLLRLMYEHRIAPSLHETAALGQDLFRAGRAAMDVKGHWMMIDYRAAGLDVGVVSIPTALSAPVSVMYLSGLCVLSRGREPRLGWEWIRFMTSEDVQRRRVASGLAISANRRAAAHFAGDPVEAEFLRQVERCRMSWGARVEQYPFIEELGQEMMRTIIHSAAQIDDPAARREMIRRIAGETARRIDAAITR
jgi:multiple sugar transport system substrate-binding protein